jgi:hypothetical protein
MSGAASLSAFLHEPGAWGDAALYSKLIAPGLPPDVGAALFAAPRTAARAQVLLAAKLGLGDPAALDPADAAILLLAPAKLRELGDCAGAVWHAKRIRSLVRGPEIAALVERFGQAARDAAMRYDPPAAQSAGGDLAGDIAHDGALCIGCWIAELPDWARARMNIVFPESAARVPDAAARAGLARRLASDILLTPS